MYDYLIVGCGLFGSVFAQQKMAEGKSVLLIDRRDHIGGNVYCKEEQGILIHRYGAHIFHTSNKRVWDYVNSFTPCNHYINAPVAFYRDRVYNLPFNMNTFAQLFSVRTPAEARAAIDREIAAEEIKEPQNLEEMALSLVGRTVYEALIKGYTEKQWGRDCKDLPPFIIKRLPLRFVYDNNYFNDPYQGIPVEGYTALCEKLTDGAHIRLSVDFREIRETWKTLAHRLVYTGMIDEYFDYAHGHLAYRSLRFEDEWPDTDNYQGNAVVNYTEREVPYTRIIEHKHFAMKKDGPTLITREYPKEWEYGDEPYYPVNDETNSALYERYKKMADGEENVLFGGRLGTYAYYDMDKVIDSALSQAEVF